MSSKKPLTLEEHRSLGQELAAMVVRLAKIHALLADRYSARLSDPAGHALKTLQDLRSELNVVVLGENRQESARVLGAVYYPGPEAREEGRP